MTLKLIPAGLDLGNGWIKIVIDGKASKIPNWSTEKEPKGALNEKTMLTAKPMAFLLEINGQSRWFGQDTLSLSGSYEMDQDKLKPDYIRMMFKAVLFRWFDQHRVEPEWLSDKRLNIICGMPPELYQDRQDRNKAEKVYKPVFSQNKSDYIKQQSNKPAIPFFTTFGGLKPETLAWATVNSLKPGYTLLVDLGYGTSDLCLLKKGYNGPVSTVTLNNGLLHSHHESNPERPWEAEARQINLIQLVVFGGGVQLLDKDTLSDMQKYATTVSCGKGYDEFSNARWFEVISKNGIEAKK
jgi:hypothetical protein